MRLVRRELFYWIFTTAAAVAAFYFVPVECPSAIGATQFQFAMVGAAAAALLARGPLAASMDGNEDWLPWFDGGGGDGSGGDGGGDGGGGD